jgi:hypothetical protein
VCIMYDITIRNLDDACLQRLRQLAWQDGRSVEEIARALVLEAAKSREPSGRMPGFRYRPTDCRDGLFSEPETPLLPTRQALLRGT